MRRRPTPISITPAYRASYAPARRLIVPLYVPRNGTHRSGFFAGTDGATLLEQSWHPAAAPRARVVLVHGLYDHCSRYAELARTLVAHHVAVYAYDLRGHAHSEGVRGEFVLAEHVADLAIRVRLASRPDDRSTLLFLLGHGVGSLIALAHAIEARVALGGLIVVAPGSRSRGASLGARLTAALRPRACLIKPELEHFSRDPRVVESYLADPRICRAGLTLRAANEIADGWKQVIEEAAAVRAPLLILQGGADMLGDPKTASMLYEEASSRDKMMHIYTGVAHDLLHEPEHESIIGDLVAWLEARLEEPLGTLPGTRALTDG